MLLRNVEPTWSRRPGVYCEFLLQCDTHAPPQAIRDIVILLVLKSRKQQYGSSILPSRIAAIRCLREFRALFYVCILKSEHVVKYAEFLKARFFNKLEQLTLTLLIMQ